MNPALLRIVYASRALAESDAPTRAADVRAILATARAQNGPYGITGLLIVANGHFLQVIEGPGATVEALFERIGRDARHRDISVLLRVETQARSFGEWAMGLVERSEPEAATTARLKLLRDRLADDPEASAADFCRLMLAPNVNPVPALSVRPRAGRESISSVAFASPTGMWSAAVLEHVSSTASLRTGRTSVIDPQDAARRTLIEYVDVEIPEIGPLRALSLAAEPAAFASVAPLMERLSLLVFMMASSDVEGFTAYVQAWLDLPQVIAASPRVLILAGMPPARVVPMLETLRAGTTLPLDFVTVKLSDSASVWRAAQWPLRGQIALRRAAAGRLPQVSAGSPPAAVGGDMNAPNPAIAASTPISTSAGSAPAASPAASVQEAQPMVNINAHAVAERVAEAGCLQELLVLEGAIAASLIDAGRGVVLLTLDEPGASPRSFDEDAEFLRGKWQLSKSLCIDDAVEDVAITTQAVRADRDLSHPADRIVSQGGS